MEMAKKEQYEHYAKKFGIPVEDIVWYNHGICYDRIIVKTLTSAEAIGKKINGDTVNGGMYHGMPLGGIHTYQQDGKTVYDVMC